MLMEFLMKKSRNRLNLIVSLFHVAEASQRSKHAGMEAAAEMREHVQGFREIL